MYMRRDGTAVERPGSIPIIAVDNGTISRRLSADGPRSVHDAYLAGSTLVIETAELWFEPYAHLCRAMTAYYDYDFTIKLYHSAAEKLILAPQSLQHDLFVIQLGGSTEWKLSREFCLAGSNDRVDQSATHNGTVLRVCNCRAQHCNLSLRSACS